MKVANRFVVLATTILVSLAAAAAQQPTSGPSSQPATNPATGVAVFGTVCLADGVTPLPDLAVFILKGGEQSSLLKKLADPLATAGTLSQTNKIGAFVSNTRLAPGTYTVVVEMTGATIAMEPLIVADTSGPEIVLHLRAAAGSLAGSVVDSAGDPAENATVTLTDRQQSRLYMVQTDKDGHYVLDHILPGHYTAMAMNSPAAAKLVGHEFYMDRNQDMVIAADRLTKDFPLQPPPGR